MFLDYLALFLLMLSGVMIFYGFIYIHDLPHKIAKEREHPHEEAIHVACWLSLLTLHAMWPIVFIWAVSHKKGRPHLTLVTASEAAAAGAPDEMTRRLTALEEQIRKLEAAKQ